MEEFNDIGEPNHIEHNTNVDIFNRDHDVNSDDATDNLDMSWLDEQERIQNIQTNYVREPMGSIHVKFIYINQNQYIDNIIHEKHALEMFIDASGSVLANDILLRLIQSKKLVTPVSKYKLVDILLYHVDLEPEHIQSYSKTENLTEQSAGFFKVLPILGNIQISPSIFIFHSTNTLYFIFQEVEIEKTTHSVVLKSILKTRKNQGIGEPVSSQKPNHNTKKVRISLGLASSSKNGLGCGLRKTRKQYR